MNKTTKGGIALGAGLLLLLGGGGTFALWNASSEADAGTVTSGELSLDGGTDGDWYHYDEYTADPLTAVAIDVATYIVVPEDHLLYVSEDTTLDAVGGNLYYTFGLPDDISDVDGYTVTFDVDGDALPGSTVTAGTTAGVDTFSDGSAVDAGTTVYHVTTATTPTTATFNVTIELVFDADDDDFFNTDVDLDGLEYVLKQVVLV